MQSFDHLVGKGEKLRRNFDTKRFRGSQIDHKLELSRLHNRQLSWFRAFKNPPDIDARMAIRIKDTSAVAHQSADHGKLAPLINRRNRMVRGEHDESIPLAVEEWVATDKKRTYPLLNKCYESRVNFRSGAGV